MSDREDNVYKAKLAEQAERYDEMFEAMKKVASLDIELTAEEHNLLALASRKITKPQRASLGIIARMYQNEESKGGEVEKELKEICSDILTLLDNHRIPCATTVENKVFYYKMKGDYHRYLSELTTATDCKQAAENSFVAYEKANEIAVNELPPTNSVRLALAVNLSVFYYEVLNSGEEACRLAETAFQDAITELDTMRSEDTFKVSSITIMQLLLDNVAAWKLDMQGEGIEGGRSEESLSDVER